MIIRSIRYTVFTYPKINIRLSCLRFLKGTFYPVNLSVLYKKRTCLMKSERNIFINTLSSDIEYPAVITGTCKISGFTADRYFFNTLIKICGKINMLKQRSGDYRPVFYRKRLENRKSEICSVLIFNSTSDKNIVITISPVRRKSLSKPVYSFGKEIKVTVFSFLYHFPAFRSPFICILQQKIRRKAGKNNLP